MPGRPQLLVEASKKAGIPDLLQLSLTIATGKTASEQHLPQEEGLRHIWEQLLQISFGKVRVKANPLHDAILSPGKGLL